MALESTKPVAEVWYSVAACDDDILRFHESHIDPYAGADIWLIRGSERDLAVDTGSGKSRSRTTSHPSPSRA